MTRFFEGLGRWVVKLRWFIVVAWIVALVASVSFLPSLNSVVQNNFQNFLPASSPSLRAAALANRIQNVNESLVVVVVDRPSAPLSAADEAYVASLLHRLRLVPTVISATPGAISPTRHAEQIEVLSRVSQFSDGGIKVLVDNVQQAIVHSHPPAGLSVDPAGAVATAVAQASQNNANASNTQMFSVLFILVLLFVVFRSLLAPFITLLPAFVVSVLAGPIVARLTSVLHYQVSNITQLLMIVLILGAGTDYGLFLVFRTREELQRGLGGPEAVERALSRVGESVSFSAFTVIAAVLSLITATFGFYKALGWPLAISVALMLLAGLTLQPALLAIFGRAAFWPSRPQGSGVRIGLWGRVAQRVVRRPALTLLVGVLFFGALAAFAPQNAPSGFATTTTAPSGTPAAAGNAALARYFPHASYNPTELVFRFRTPIWEHLDTLVTLQRAVEHSPLFYQVTSPLDPAGFPISPGELAALHARLGDPRALPPTPPAGMNPILYAQYRELKNLIGPGGHTVVVAASLTAGAPGSTQAMNQVPTIRAFTAHLAARVGATANGVAGEAPASYDVSSASNHDLTHIVPIVILIIGVLLALVLRSVVAPLFLVVSVALSYFAALGLAVIVFMKLDHQSGLIFVLPFMVFLFLLALGEDYNILVMTRIREEAHDLSMREAVVQAIGATGSTVTSAGVVLAGTFAVLALASLGQTEVEEIGFGLALGVLMDTFLVRSLLVPSSVVLIGRLAWWPSRLSRTVHLEGTPQEDAEIEGVPSRVVARPALDADEH